MSLDPSLELSVLWDIWGVLWEENILLRDITQGENLEIVCKKSGIMFDSQAGIQ